MAKQRETGELEAEVLAVLWTSRTALSPGEVLIHVDGVAYTTVMTILSRLWKKGLVERERRGRAFVYTAKLTQAELAAQRKRATLDSTADRRAVLNRFVDGLSRRDEQHLRRVLAELEER